MRIHFFQSKSQITHQGLGTVQEKIIKKTYWKPKTGTKIPFNHSSVKRLYLHACYRLIVVSHRSNTFSLIQQLKTV